MPASDRLRSALADHYSIERELGSGGMATVYLARDLKHDREVALKVLRADLSAVIGSERFLSEVRIAAKLDHPHILTLIDSGSADGILYYVLPYVRGESLRAKLDREKQLSVQDAVSITTQVASALDYAHAQGVVHRDIKPENILLHEGEAMLADFGIALAVKAAGGNRLTETGLSLGTPLYMSPEQATGERSLDRRSDVYSLGAVFYEMIAGEPPVTGPNAQAIIAKLLTQKPVKLRLVRDTIPLAMEQATERALAKTPVDRFASAGEFARALSAAAPEPDRRVARSRMTWAAVAIAAVAIIGAGLWLAREKSTESAAAAGTPRDGMVPAAAVRLAVLPFENLGRAEDAYVVDGITDEVRGKLSLLPSLQVIARNSSVNYQRTPKPASQIARELGVRYLLTGTVRWELRSGGRTGRVRVSPELVEVTGGGAPVTKWQHSFDAPLTNVFDVQADVASRVAQALDVQLGAGESARLATPPAANLVAYDMYLRGEEVSNAMAASDPATLQRAIRFYERAVALDSGFAQAWGRLALARIVLHVNSPGRRSANLAATARTAADRALALAPDHPEGWVAMSEYYRWIEGDLPRAAQQVARGLRVAPNDASLLRMSGHVSESLGRWDQALGDYRRATVLDPRSSRVADAFGVALLWRRQYTDARASLDHAQALAPDDIGIREDRAMVELARGDLAGARQVLAAGPPVEPTALAAFLGAYWDLGWVLDDAHQRLLVTLSPEAFDDDRLQWSMALANVAAVRGDAQRVRVYADSARAVSGLAITATPNDAQLHASRGVALAYLGRRDEAIQEGERAVSLVPVSKDAYEGAYFQQQLARIYILVGEPVKALDRLEPLLKMPYFLSPGWLRIDPSFAPLRGNPRFERLTRG